MNTNVYDMIRSNDLDLSVMNEYVLFSRKTLFWLVKTKDATIYAHITWPVLTFFQ